MKRVNRIAALDAEIQAAMDWIKPRLNDMEYHRRNKTKVFKSWLDMQKLIIERRTLQPEEVEEEEEEIEEEPRVSIFCRDCLIQSEVKPREGDYRCPVCGSNLVREL